MSGALLYFTFPAVFNTKKVMQAPQTEKLSFLHRLRVLRAIAQDPEQGLLWFVKITAAIFSAIHLLPV